MNHYCDIHYSYNYPCEECHLLESKFEEIMNSDSSPYVFVQSAELPNLIVEVNEKITNHDYKPLGPPVLGIYHEARQGTSNFGALSTSNRSHWYQFLSK